MANKYQWVKQQPLHLFSLLMMCGVLLLNTPSTATAANYDAKIEKISVTTKMLLGRSYEVSIRVLNTGSSAWTSATNLQLITIGNAKNTWRIKTGKLNANERVQPGSKKTFHLKVTAPNTTGIYGLQFQIVFNGSTIGSNSKTKMIVVEDRVNRVKFISQLLPEKMASNQIYSVVMQFRNNGSSTWTRRKGYKLALKTKRGVWSQSVIRLGKNVAVPPGEIATFQFNLTSPNKPGLYPIQWRMKKGSKWFGEPTPKLKVEVSELKSNSGAEFVYQNVPGTQKMGQLFTVLNRGDIYPVTVTFKNTSEESWTPGRVALGSQNPPGSMTWSTDRIDLKSNEVIKPSGIKSFSFKIIAPLQPGIYHFQWQMLKGFNNWVGEKSDNISVTVK